MYGALSKYMNHILDSILDAAKKWDIPVLGIGPCGETGNRSPEARQDDRLPAGMLPGAQSQISFGIPVPAAVYAAGAHPLEMVWRSQNLLYRRLDTVSLVLAQILERNGVRAVPVFGCQPMDVDRKGRVTGYVNQLRLGELAGIGKIGRSGLLLHRQYGARLMLGTVLVSIELPGLRIPEIDQPECPEGCRICIDACPVNAIHGDGTVNVMRCLAYTSRTPLMSRPLFALLGKLRPKTAARYMTLRAFDEHTFHTCSRCVSECRFGEPAVHGI